MRISRRGLHAWSRSKQQNRYIVSSKKKCDSRHPILQTASDLIAIERPLSPETV